MTSILSILSSKTSSPNQPGLLTPLPDHKGILSRITDTAFAALKELHVRRQRRYNPMINRAFRSIIYGQIFHSLILASMTHDS